MAIEWGELKYKAKVKAIKTKNDVMNFWYNNKEELKIIVPAIAIGGSSIVKTLVKHHDAKAERDLKERFIYDNRHGHYNELRRKMTVAERREFDARHDAGELDAVILESMKLLKK